MNVRCCLIVLQGIEFAVLLYAAMSSCGLRGSQVTKCDKDSQYIAAHARRPL